MTDASNDACSSGAVRSTASVSRLGLFQGVPEAADKAGCKVELAQNYPRNSGHVCAGTERPAGSTKLMVHDLFASQGGERVWFAG
ncbi:hypothetical protein MCOR11_000229 [Pyricularia oryzae]|nr:hypothetical protein MCOR11_000229 [Pyricularia oryzae]